MRVITLTTELPVPYKRLPHTMRHSEIAKRYHASRDELMTAIRVAEISQRRGQPADIAGPYRVHVHLAIPVAKRTTTARRTGGDADNYLKAILDAMVRMELVTGDGPDVYRGGSLDVHTVTGDPGWCCIRIEQVPTPATWDPDVLARHMCDAHGVTDAPQIVAALLNRERLKVAASLAAKRARAAARKPKATP